MPYLCQVVFMAFYGKEMFNVEKYWVLLDNCTVGLRWDSAKNRVLIGGYNRDRLRMKELMRFYFSARSVVHETNPSANRVRFWFIAREAEVVEALEEMREDNIVLEPTNGFGRLMR